MFNPCDVSTFSLRLTLEPGQERATSPLVFFSSGGGREVLSADITTNSSVTLLLKNEYGEVMDTFQTMDNGEFFEGELQNVLMNSIPDGLYYFELICNTKSFSAGYRICGEEAICSTVAQIYPVPLPDLGM